jgi:HSP20 family protein
MVHFRNDPPSGYGDLQREMERFLDHLAHQKGRSFVFQSPAWQPRVDLYETPDCLVAIVELPGVSPEGVELIVDRGMLLLRGTRGEPALPGCARAETKQAYHLMEIHFGAFERSLKLPAPVDSARVEAQYEAGFLEVRMPKARAATPERVVVRLTSAEQ